MFNQSFPCQAGVYWYLDNQGQVIYVGKAKNLKNRILSYKYLSGRSKKTLLMLSQAKKINFKTTDSELEALLLEAELIKRYQPTYNIRLTDDKSPLYLYLTSDRFPQLKTIRKQQLIRLKIKKTALFGPYPSAAQAQAVLRLTRKIFPFCSASSADIKAKKACFYFHLHLCPGICVGKISAREYFKNIAYLKLFLRGKKTSVLSALQAELKTVVKQQDFSSAILIRDQINLIRSLHQALPRPQLNLPQLIEDKSLNQLTALLQILRTYLSLPAHYPLTRIEGYDISNLEGRQATASMVVFLAGRPAKHQYRHFKINTLTTPNDPAMLRQTFCRRIRHLDWGIPNLIVIDGGLSQLRAGLNTIPWNIPILALAKKPDRLLLPQTKIGKVITLPLDPKNPATHLLQFVRNESHRFAKNYHLKLRRRHTLAS